jgi:AcrR family transcriptional regulator
MAEAVPLTGGALTRSRILDAAAELMGRVGISATTTKEIARVAGCSEATLYKHFRDKEEIFLRVLRERTPRFADALTQLPERAGTGELAEHLTEVARSALAFYRRSFPIAASLFGQPDLLASVRRKLDLTESGPQEATRLLAHYLRLEQRHGRVRGAVDPASAAVLLVGACFHRAFLELFFADEAPAGVLRPASTEEFVSEVVRALTGGLEPNRRG